MLFYDISLEKKRKEKKYHKRPLTICDWVEELFKSTYKQSLDSDKRCCQV